MILPHPGSTLGQPVRATICIGPGSKPQAAEIWLGCRYKGEDLFDPSLRNEQGANSNYAAWHLDLLLVPRLPGH